MIIRLISLAASTNALSVNGLSQTLGPPKATAKWLNQIIDVHALVSPVIWLVGAIPAAFSLSNAANMLSKVFGTSFTPTFLSRSMLYQRGRIAVSIGRDRRTPSISDWASEGASKVAFQALSITLLKSIKRLD
ncbi:MAG: hypothetical protein BWY50_01779 [Spirochaetes bacterium ADurb.Bin315]|nr:MAG: hypothetical protein BWY50_01779 [Spirochaetes bacterium ADurb.Bin315]